MWTMLMTNDRTLKLAEENAICICGNGKRESEALRSNSDGAIP